MHAYACMYIYMHAYAICMHMRAYACIHQFYWQLAGALHSMAMELSLIGAILYLPQARVYCRQQ